MFLRIDCARIPKRRRAGFVATAVKRAVPFGDPESQVVWLGESAAVWAWSRQRVRDIAGTWGDRDRFEAESPHVGSPHDHAIRLAALRVGVEGRVWRGGVLVASHWWNATPEQAAFAEFIRSAGVHEHAEIGSVITDGGFSEAGWHSPGNDESLKRLRPYVPAIATSAALLVAAAFLFQVGQIARARIELGLARSALEARSSDFSRILSARESAERDQMAIEGLLGLRPPAPQMRLLREAESLMSGTGWRITRWAQANPEALEVAFKLANPDSEGIVSRWEDSALFEDVVPTLDRDGNGLTLRMTVVPQRGDEP